LPLRWNHAIGACLGWLAWCFSSRHRRLMRENLACFGEHQGIDPATLLSVAIAEQGRGIAELAIAWTAPMERLYALVKSCSGWEHIDAAKAANRAIIFVTPHLGCFDIAGRYIAQRIPITALYQPPKQAWMSDIMQQGRVRGAANTAAAGAGGVRALLKTLKSGGNILVLPDQVPAPGQGGDGAWADFFGRPAYTMTLLPRLAQSTNAAVLFFFAKRLPKGEGYHVHIEPMAAPFSADREIAARETNAMIERLIAMAPAQYLWGYNRYKQPAGAPASPE
jgi:Kdo2-lipid IVA lauroyltransferase/acyltransferase